MNLNELWIKYWWVIVLIAGLILFYIYNRLDAYTKKQISKVLNKRNIFIVGFILIWYFWNKYGEFVTISKANEWMPILALIVVAGTQFVEGLRNQTQQFITPNFHGSFAKPPKYVNGFYIFAIDSFNAGGISWDFAKRIAVVREETVELFVEGALSIANMGVVSKYELDDDVRQFIENNKFFKGASQEVYYGWFDSLEKVDWEFQKLKQLAGAKEYEGKPHIYNLLKQELGVKNPKVTTLFWLYKNQCKATSKQTEQFDATVETVEKGVEHAKRVREGYVDEKKQKTVEGGEEY